MSITEPIKRDNSSLFPAFYPSSTLNSNANSMNNCSNSHGVNNNNNMTHTPKEKSIDNIKYEFPANETVNEMKVDYTNKINITAAKLQPVVQDENNSFIDVVTDKSIQTANINASNNITRIIRFESGSGSNSSSEYLNEQNIVLGITSAKNNF